MSAMPALQVSLSQKVQLVGTLGWWSTVTEIVYEEKSMDTICDGK